MAEVKNLFGGGDFERPPADDPNVVLDAAKDRLKNVIIIGVEHDDALYLASDTKLTIPDAMWLAEKFKKVLLSYD